MKNFNTNRHALYYLGGLCQYFVLTSFFLSGFSIYPLSIFHPKMLKKSPTQRAQVVRARLTRPILKALIPQGKLKE